MLNDTQDNRKLAAIMFTDMVGYSTLMQKSESHALALLDEHQKILRTIFPAFHGTEISTIGDAFLVEFESAFKAVQCGIEIQKTLRRRNDDNSPDNQIRLRIGIHIGDVQHTGDNILGDGVNIAARIYPLAPPEGIFISEDVARQVENMMELPLHKLEKQQLKNIERSVEIYSIGLPWLPKPEAAEKTDIPPIIPMARGKRKILWSVSTLFVLAVLAGMYFFLQPPRATGPNSKTIAVLPFTNMSSNPEEEYFSDGITDDILTQLCKVADVNVISRTTMARYKGSRKSIREIGEELHAGVVLEGSVRRDGNNIRITSQLIDAATDRHLWAETYDREMKSVFAIQSEIAQNITSALQAKLSPAEKHLLANPTTTNTEAYNAFLQGQFFYNRRSKENLEKALGYYEQVLRIDPNYARAWEGLSWVHSTQADNGYVSVDEGYRKARQETEKALQLDPNLAIAHCAIGWIKWSYDWDWTGAEASFRRARELEPGNARVVANSAIISATLGRFDEAIRLCRRAIEMDPLRTFIHSNLGVYTYYVGRLEQSEAAFRRVLELDPISPGTHRFLGLIYLARSKPEQALSEMQKEPEPNWRIYGLALAYHAMGKKKEADAALAEYIRKYQNDAAYQVTEIYAYRGKTDKAFEWLDRAYRQRDGGLSEMKGNPLLKNLEHDSRYAAFMKKMRLPL